MRIAIEDSVDVLWRWWFQVTPCHFLLQLRIRDTLILQQGQLCVH